MDQVNFGPRVPGTDAQVKCRDYLVEQLKKGCDDAHTQHLTHHWIDKNKDIDLWNVIGTQNWKDAKVRVVLLAHWDSRPYSDGPNAPKEDYEKPIAGADDGASGVAVLLELAQAIKDKHPGLGVMYLLDDGEDTGPPMEEMLLGVRYFVDNLPDPRPDYGILLDMIGNKNTRIPMEVESYNRAQRVTKQFYLNAQKIGLSKTFPYELGDDMDDDHIPFLDKGIPCMDLIDFKYPYWHTQQDTADKCSQESLKNVGIALESFLTRNPPFNPNG